MSPARSSAAKSGPSPQPRSASASGPEGNVRASNEGSRSASKWIAVSVYRSLTRARLRGGGPTVAGVALAAADLEAAPRALERAVSPLHERAAAQADLDGLGRGLGGQHGRTLGRGEDGYDGRSGAVAEWLGRGLQSLVQRYRVVIGVRTRMVERIRKACFRTQ